MPPTSSAAAPRAISADSFAGMFQAVDGLRNGRAVVALMGCWVAAVLLGALLSMLAVVIGGLAGLLSAVGFVVVAGTGINAAGALQMDQARGLAPRSLGDALAHGLACVPKMIVLGLVLLAVAIAVFVLIAIALFICKIPYLGALLYVVVFPLSVLLAGVTLTALFFGWLLALPAIWDGAPIARAIAQTLAVVRSRFVEALLLLFVVGLLCLAVALIIFSVIGSGIVPTVALSLPIFGMDAMYGSAFMGDLMQGVGAGRAAAAGIGLMVLWAIAFAVIAQVYLHGLNRVYLRVTHGLDVESAEAALQQTVNTARERGAEIGEKARAAAASARERATAPSPERAASEPVSRPPPPAAPMPDPGTGLIARAGAGGVARNGRTAADDGGTGSARLSGSAPRTVAAAEAAGAGGAASAGAGAAGAAGGANHVAGVAPTRGAPSRLRAGDGEPDFRPTQPFDDAFEPTVPPADDKAAPPQPFATRLQPSPALGRAATRPSGAPPRVDAAQPAAGSATTNAEAPIAPAVEPASAADTFEPFTTPDPGLGATGFAPAAPSAPTAPTPRGGAAAPFSRELDFDLPASKAAATSGATSTASTAGTHATGPTATSGAGTIECPHCHAICAADDAFCEACGQRLP